jgi:deoxyribose-phosphate aldolase
MNFDRNIARLIDHTILKPEATRSEVLQICAEALRFEFASVCVNSFWVPLVAGKLGGSASKVCAVVGFPLGASGTAAKVSETLGAVSEGAREIDMVLNIGALRGGEYDHVEADIRAVVAAAQTQGAIVKVILETCLLNNEQKVAACEISKRAAAAFVKTSTGFSKSGATVEDVALMRRTVGPEMGVKASGGIRSIQDVQAMVAAGATRIGSSSGVKIVQGEGGAPGGATGGGNPTRPGVY